MITPISTCQRCQHVFVVSVHWNELALIFVIMAMPAQLEDLIPKLDLFLQVCQRITSKNYSVEDLYDGKVWLEVLCHVDSEYIFQLR
jgi:hypothetical protein